MSLFDCTKINLKNGSTGNNVTTLQTTLKTLGYYTRQIDGSYGYYTVQAVKKFQNVYKLSADGVFGPKSCAKMNSVMESKNNTTTTTTTSVMSINCSKINLKEGSSGENVRKLQRMLHDLGYYNGLINGIFGSITKSSVKAFQKATGHSTDGVFGPKTCPDLNKAYQELQNKKTSNTTSKSTSTQQTPEHLKTVTYQLIVLPDVVVLPTSQTNLENNTKTVTGGSIDPSTNFDCSKINLSRGSKGEDVKKLQTILKAKGYYTRQVDGSFGEYTSKAVKKLQKTQGNSEDGVFGPKTCSKLQQNNNSTTTKKTVQNYVINDIKPMPSYSADLEGLSYDISLTTPHTKEKMKHIKKLQKTLFTLQFDENKIIQHQGYINDIKVSNTDDTDIIELQLVGYTVFLEQTIDIPSDITAKRSELLKKFAEQVGMKLNLDLTGLPDDEYTVKAQQKETAGSSDGGAGLTTLSGNDCTGGAMQTNQLSAVSFDINQCGGNTKIGNSNANYAKDTAGMSAKEAVMDVYNRFKYGISLSSKAPYKDNRRCPQTMWQKTGKMYGNCADISRLIKCVGEVHGLKVGIRHAPNHYYNLIEVNGKTYRFDCCFKSGTSGSRYGGEYVNTLSMRGGPWS